MTQQKPVSSRFVLSVLLCACLFGTTACSEHFELPSVVAERRAEVATGTVNQTYAASVFSNGFMDQLANHYSRYGAGKMYMTVTYDPKASGDAGGDAARLSARISNYLKINGVNEIQVDTLPTPHAGTDPQVMVRYGTIMAQAPEGCGEMPGMSGGATTNNTAYGYGCGVETLLAQQVANPADLAGRAPNDVTGDGARQTAVINDRGYYGNTAFPALAGSGASEE